MFSVLRYRKGILAWHWLSLKFQFFLVNLWLNWKFPLHITYFIFQKGHYREENWKALQFNLSAKQEKNFRFNTTIYKSQLNIPYFFYIQKHETKWSYMSSIYDAKKGRNRGQVKSRKNMDISNEIWWLPQA